MMKKLFIPFLILICWAAFSCKKEHNRDLPENTREFALNIAFDTLDKPFNNIYFVNEQTGYLIGPAGTIYKTNDGANTWVAQESNTTLPLYGIYFLNENEGFVAGGEDNCGGTGCVVKEPVLLHTTDGGKTWQNVPIAPSYHTALRSIFFPTNSTGFVVGGKIILSTHDQGKTWQEAPIQNVQGMMQDVQFVNEQDGLIACSFGKLLKTTDGGRHWSVSSPFPQVGANTLSILSKDLAYSAGYTEIQKSTDFGDSWTSLAGAPKDIFKLVFTTKDMGYAFGRGKYSGGDFGRNYGAIYYTTDGGRSWAGNDTIRETNLISAASFVSPDKGYALSGHMLLKITKP